MSCLHVVYALVYVLSVFDKYFLRESQVTKNRGVVSLYDIALRHLLAMYEITLKERKAKTFSEKKKHERPNNFNWK